MCAAPSTRRAVAEVDMGDGQSSAYKIGNRSIHQFWHLFSSHFRFVLLPPQRRPDSGRVAWTWREAGEARPVTATEIAEVRRRLSEGSRSLGGGFEREDNSGSGASLDAQVRPVVVELVAQLVAQRDSVLASYVCRTDAGLMVHSWGAPTAAKPYFPDAQHAEISGRLVSDGESVAGAEVALETAAGGTVTRVTADREGGFRFVHVAPGQYRVRVRDRSEFPADGLAVTLERESLAGLELRAIGTGAAPVPVAPIKIADRDASRRNTRRLVIAALLLLLLGGGGWWWKTRPGAVDAPRGSTAASGWQSADGGTSTATPTETSRVGHDAAWTKLEAATAKAPVASTPTSKAVIGKSPAGVEPRAAAADASESTVTGDSAPTSDRSPRVARPTALPPQGARTSAPGAAIDPAVQSPAADSKESDAVIDAPNASAVPSSAIAAKKSPSPKPSPASTSGLAAGTAKTGAAPSADETAVGGEPAAAAPEVTGAKPAPANRSTPTRVAASPASNPPEVAVPPAPATTLATDAAVDSPAATAASVRSPDQKSIAAASAKAAKNSSPASTKDESAESPHDAESAAPSAPAVNAPSPVKSKARSGAAAVAKPTDAVEESTSTPTEDAAEGAEAVPARSAPARSETAFPSRSPTPSPAHPSDAPKTAESLSEAPSKALSTSARLSPERPVWQTILRVRAGEWRARLVHDAIVPTRPVTAAEAKQLETLRAKLLEERKASLPNALRDPRARVGFEFESDAASGLNWSRPTSSVSARENQATWSAPTTAGADAVELLDVRGRVLARVEQAADGSARVSAVDGVRVSLTVTIETGGVSLEWRRLAGAPWPEGWTAANSAEAGQPIRWQWSVPAVRASARVVELSAVDPRSGWALSRQVTVE